MGKDRTHKELADFARLVVRAGYLNRARTSAEVGNFVRAELDDDTGADELTERLVAEAVAELAAEQATWGERTDNDALSEVLAELAERGFLTLEYCQDHVNVQAELRARPGVVGVVFFTETDVWHAVAEHRLELKVWHPDSTPVTEDDPELAVVLDTLRRHGLSARLDDGQVQLAITWRKRQLF